MYSNKDKSMTLRKYIKTHKPSPKGLPWCTGKWRKSQEYICMTIFLKDEKNLAHMSTNVYVSTWLRDVKVGERVFNITKYKENIMSTWKVAM